MGKRKAQHHFQRPNQNVRQKTSRVARRTPQLETPAEKASLRTTVQLRADFEVEAILNERIKFHEKIDEVKCVGFIDTTWEPVEHLAAAVCTSEINKYRKVRKGRDGTYAQERTEAIQLRKEQKKADV